MTSKSTRSNAAARKKLHTRITAAQKQAQLARKAAKLAKLGYRKAKQKFKEVRRAAKKLRKALKALKAELASAARKPRRKRVSPPRTPRHVPPLAAPVFLETASPESMPPAAPAQ